MFLGSDRSLLVQGLSESYMWEHISRSSSIGLIKWALSMFENVFERVLKKEKNAIYFFSNLKVKDQITECYKFLPNSGFVCWYFVFGLILISFS